jgi:hypothetical protein
VVDTVPLVSPYLNVATELLPFFITGGWTFAIAIILLTFIILFYLKNKLISDFNIFTYVIFLRFFYCALFFNFAPQFYTWSSLGFILVIATLKVFDSYSYNFFKATPFLRGLT